MNKKRIFILTALILAVCLVFSMFAIACDKNDGNSDNNNANSTLLFTNGTFASGTGDSALTSPSNWTGSAGSTASSSSSSYTPSGENDLTRGVVGTSSSEWKALQKKYKHITASSPGRGKSSEDDDEPHQQSTGSQKTFPQEVKTVNSLHVTKEKNRAVPIEVRAIRPIPEESRHWLLQPITFDHQDYFRGIQNAGWTALVLDSILTDSNLHKS